MTAKWFRITPKPAVERWQQGSRLGRAVLVVALASVFVLLLSTSSVPRALSVSVARVSPAEAPVLRTRAPDTNDAPSGRAGFAGGQHIDAVAALIAKKYRVSEQATRGVVAAAYREGSRNRVDPLLLLAVIAIESRFNPIAQSEMGAVGLMQVIPHYHADKLGAIEPASVLEPRMNIEVGARILKDYIVRGGNEVAGLQLYNGTSADSSNAYANRVLGEKRWLENGIARGKERSRA